MTSRAACPACGAYPIYEMCPPVRCPVCAKLKCILCATDAEIKGKPCCEEET